MAESISFNWEPITDLPEDWQRLTRPDLDDSLQSWRRERGSLKVRDRVERLEERLAVTWAIETGVIERLYKVDRGVTETLIDLGLQALDRFSTNGRLERSARQLIEDQREALEFIFATVKQERPISASFIRELHQLLCRHQDTTEGLDQFGNRIRTQLIKGDWKKLPNNPTRDDGSKHEYCPPEIFVQDEIEQLMKWHREHSIRSVRPEVEAAWLHHRFTQIHPFQDGNGRVARALATLVFLQSDFLPLVIRDAEHTKNYIAALETADQGDLQPLVSLFANVQSADLEEAITFVREIRGEGIGQIAAAAAGAVRRRQIEQQAQLDAATDRLVTYATSRLREVAHELEEAFAQEFADLHTGIESSNEATEAWWHHQIVAAAREYGYFADLGRTRRWVQLRVSTPPPVRSRWNFVISFHHKDVRTGLMAVVAFLTTTDAGLEEPRPLELGASSEFSFSASTRDVETLFEPWLDDSVEVLLDKWQARL